MPPHHAYSSNQNNQKINCGWLMANCIIRAQQFYLIMSTHQQMLRSCVGRESAHSRLALLSYLTEKEGSSHFKKKSFFWDQEYLYSQNLKLRSQLKQLTESNTKARTRILEMEEELRAKHTRNNDQYKETVVRSMSLRNISRKSLTFVRSHQDEEPKQTARRLIRELKQEVQSLKNENSELKRTMKYTRMSELQTLNKEMQIQMQRLNRLAIQAKDKYYAITVQLEGLREHLRRESDTRSALAKERDRLKRDVTQLKEQAKKRAANVRIANPQKERPLQGITFKSFPKLQYSISAIQKVESETINFDKLINTDSQLKSPQVQSNSQLEVHKQPVSIANEVSFKQVDNEEEQYDFEEQQSQHRQQEKGSSQQVVIAQRSFAPEETTKSLSPTMQRPQQEHTSAVNHQGGVEVQQSPLEEQVYEDLMEQQFEQ